MIKHVKVKFTLMTGQVTESTWLNVDYKNQQEATSSIKGLFSNNLDLLDIQVTPTEEPNEPLSNSVQ